MAPHPHANTQLPDDPAELQRLVEKREAELRVAKVQLKERVAAKEAEVAAKEAEVGKVEARLETAEIKLTISNTELLRFKRTCVYMSTHPRSRLWPHLAHPFMYLPADQLTIRHVMELVERTYSPKKAKNPSLSRRETWMDIFECRPDVEAQVREISGAEDTEGAVRAIQNLYKVLSEEIHNPNVRDVPIPLGLLTYVNAALAVLQCRLAPVSYHLLSADGAFLGRGYTPEQVKRRELPGEGGGEG